MAEDAAGVREWGALYESFARVKELAPWEWMTEADVFAVRDPESGGLGFVSVMGMLGEHYAVGLYLGSEGIHGFLDMQEMGPFMGPDSLLQIPQLQASLEDRGELDKKDREVIKELGLKFRGRKAWPMFRSYRPSFLPWFVESEEARFLSVALEQLSDVAPRFRENPSLLEPSDGGYLLREPRREGGALLWEDSSTGVPPLDAAPIEVEMEAAKIEALGSLPRREVRLEVDFFMFPAPVKGEGGSRPYFPHMLLAVEAESAMILGSELLAPEPSPEAMWGLVPESLADQLLGAEMAPEKVTVDSELLFQLLEPLAEEAGFEMELSESLPSMELLREDLLQTFSD